MDVGKPQKFVDVERDNANDHPGATFAHGVIQRAGETLCPVGFKYEASATVHLYFKADEHGLGRTSYVFVCSMRGFDGVPEQQADAAFKELMRTMMENYGRKAPEHRS